MERGEGWTDSEILGRLVPSVEGGLKLLEAMREKDSVERIDLRQIEAAFGLAKYWMNQWRKKIESKDTSKQGQEARQQEQDDSHGMAEGAAELHRGQ